MHLSDADWNETAAFAVRLAMEEALTNAVRHGHAGDDVLPIEIECSIGTDAITLSVTDQGPGFELSTVPDPRADENLTVASGRGLALIRAFMTEVKVVEPGNRIEMQLLRSAPSSEQPASPAS
jgi:serine/threonine-protein kinase RsbW